jgi:hypothetical protein
MIFGGTRSSEFSLRQYETKNLNIIMSRLQSFSTGTLLKFSCARLVVVY